MKEKLVKEPGIAAVLLRMCPVGILLIDNKIDIAYENAEASRFIARFGMPVEVRRISGRMFEALRSSRMNELFPGEVYIEKTFDRSTSKWLFKLSVIEKPQPLVVVFIIEESIANRLNMNEIRIRYRLSRRQTDVLRRVLRGLKNTQIAEDLAITEQTVKDHLSSIYVKMGIRNRKDLMRLFMGPQI